MKSPCAIRRMLAEQFALTTRLYAETSVSLAMLGTSGMEYVRLRDDTIDACQRSEAAFRAFIQHIASHQCGLHGAVAVQTGDMAGAGLDS